MDDRIELIQEWAENKPWFDLTLIDGIEEYLQKHGSLTVCQDEALDNIISSFRIKQRTPSMAERFKPLRMPWDYPSQPRSLSPAIDGEETLMPTLEQVDDFLEFYEDKYHPEDDEDILGCAKEIEHLIKGLEFSARKYRTAEIEAALAFVFCSHPESEKYLDWAESTHRRYNR